MNTLFCFFSAQNAINSLFSRQCDAEVQGQIWGEGTVRRPVGFSLLIPPSRMHTRGKFTFTRCDANWEETG